MTTNDLNRRIAALSPARREALRRHLREYSATREAAPTALAAAVIPDGDRAPDGESLRTWLAARLPEVMVPGIFDIRDSLPRLPNGKVDRAAIERNLAAPPPPGAPAAAPAPVTGANEATLAAIWGAVLGIEPPARDANFFDLGGDSIRAMQIISRARQSGMTFTTRQLFAHPTVAELATLAAPPDMGATEPSRAAAADPAALSPIQAWFFSENLADPHHWHMTALITLPPDVDGDRLRDALTALNRHHEALRLRFPTADGRRHARIVPADDAGPSLREETLPVEAALADRIAAIGGSISLDDGPLWRAVLFRPGTAAGPQLLLCLHHLIVDVVSWGILLTDLQSLYRSPDPERLPKSASLADWTAALHRYAGSEAARWERAYWQAPADPDAGRIPFDLHTTDGNVEGSARHHQVRLGTAETAALRARAGAGHPAAVLDHLLTALAATLADWCGRDTVRINMEGHGRTEVAPGLELSRTVGWFTGFFPLTLAHDPGQSPAAMLGAVRAAREAVPLDGTGFGILRYLGNDAVLTARLAALGHNDVLFNYLGHHTGTADGDGSWPAELGVSRSPRNRRHHPLEITAWIAKAELVVRWEYSERLHREATIHALAGDFRSRLEGLIAADVGGGAGSGRTFPMADLSEAKMDKLAALLNKKDRSPR